MTDQRDVVEAVGKLTEAWETVQRARGHLYSFHQLTGGADLVLDEAVAGLRAAGQPALAHRIEHDLIGRNVLPGQWTFEVVEAYDDHYYRYFEEIEREVREALVGGRRHAHEARLKRRRQDPGPDV